MLKFLRKYQLIIMIIGGSLLMVIFLLEPVITRLAPSTSKRTIATIGDNQQKVSIRDRDLANSQFSAARAVAPALFVWPSALSILEINESADHWLLLAHEAEKNGLVGEAGDGQAWLPELARLQAVAEVRSQIFQQFGSANLPQSIINQLLSQPQTQQQIQTRAEQLTLEMPLRAQQATGVSPFFKTVDDVHESLSIARGITRLIALHSNTPKASVPEAESIISKALDGVAIDYVVLSPELVLSSLADPTDAELRAHFDEFKALTPAESDYNIGYVLPPRVQLEYLTLDKQLIADAIEVDRVEISKRFQRNPDAYNNDLATATPAIRQQIKAETAEQIMVEADRIIKGAIFNATRQFDKDQNDLPVDVPEDWQAPTYEDIAQRVVEGVKGSLGYDIPLPLVTRRANSWLTSQTISTLPGLGRASFRIGANTISAPGLATIMFNEQLKELMPMKIGLPHVKDAATDSTGSRYYVNVLAARDTSPAESIDEVGQELVRADAKQILAFDLLNATANSLLDLARGSGLEAIPQQYSSQPSPPVVQTSAIVRTEQADTEQLVDARLNTDDARQAILNAARERLDPLQGPDDVSPADAYITVDLPQSRAVAIVKLIARRPPTVELARRVGESLVARELNAAIGQRDDFAALYPFNLDALKSRHNFTLVDDRSAPEEAPSDETTEDAAEADTAAE